MMARDYHMAKERWQHATVMSRVGVKSYLLKLPNGLIWKRHSDQMVKANRRGREETHDSWNPDLEEDTEENRHEDTIPNELTSRRKVGTTEDLGDHRVIPEKVRAKQIQIYVSVG